MNEQQRETQLINRVYGNLAIENPRITREIVAEQLKKFRKSNEFPVSEMIQKGDSTVIDFEPKHKPENECGI